MTLSSLPALLRSGQEEGQIVRERNRTEEVGDGKKTTKSDGEEARG